jgi:hypothetical protein
MLLASNAHATGAPLHTHIDRLGCAHTCPRRLTSHSVLMWHWIGCYYYHFAITASDDDPTYQLNTADWFPDTWMTASHGQRYVYSLQWAVGITCQMNVPSPQNLSQQVYGTFVMMSSVMIMAMVIGCE